LFDPFLNFLLQNGIDKLSPFPDFFAFFQNSPCKEESARLKFSHNSFA